MIYSDNCLNLVEHFEGAPALTLTLDVGKPMIGFGHDLTPWEILTGKYKNGITEQEALQLLKSDLQARENHLNMALVGIKVNQNQFDALMDFVYNEGIVTFLASSVYLNLRKGNYDLAAKSLKLYNKATINGKLTVLAGLIVRRQKEYDLFTS